MAPPPLLLAAALLLGILPLPAGAQSVRGRILDGTNREAVGGATVRLIDPDSQQVATTIADDAGFFVVPAPGTGEFRVTVERIGYVTTLAGPVRLRANGFVSVTVEMAPQPVPVGAVGVQVEAQEPALSAAGFYDRRQEGMGKYLDHIQIEKRGSASRMSDVLQGISGVRVLNHNSGTDVQLRSSMTNVFRGQPSICLPLIFLDGLLVADAMTPGPGRMNLETIRPQDVAGIEIYGEAGAPLQYARGGGACGVVLFWTKSGRGRR